MEDETQQPEIADPEAEKKARQKLLKRWQARVDRAKKMREEWEKQFKVETLEKFFLGNQGPGDGPVFNHFLATLKATEPELFYTNPTFLVRPKPAITPANPIILERQQKMSEGLLQNIAAQDDNLEEAAELGTAQAHFRMGVLKVCYYPALVPNPKAGEPIFVTDAGGLPVLGPPGVDPATGQATLPQPAPLKDPMTGEPILEPPMVMDDEVYSFEWADARCMLLPDAGPYEKKWDWIGEEITVPLEEAKEDERFPYDLRQKLKSNATREPGKKKDASGDTDTGEDELFKYYECYDIRKKRWAIWCDGQGQDFDDFLLEDVFPAGIEDHPYEFLRFTLNLGPEPSPWPMPETHSWMSVQQEYNKRREQITQGCNRSARKIYYDNGTFDDDDEAKKSLQSSKDLEAVKVQNVDKTPVGLTDPPMPQDIIRDVPLLLSDWRIITGQTGARLGSPDSDTATEATFAERASNARSAQKRKLITRWLRGAGRKMLQLMKDTMTLDKMIRIKGLNDQDIQMYAVHVYKINPMMLQAMPGLKELLIAKFGQEEWMKITREDLTFESELDVVPGSMRPRTLETERRDKMEFLSLIGQFPQLLFSRELLNEMATSFEFLSPRMVDELVALAPVIIGVAQKTAGRGGDNGQGGGPGPTPEQNTATVMQGMS